MTYEKAEKQSFTDYMESDLRRVVGEANEWLAHKTGFRDGYEFGKKANFSTIDHERNLVALGDEYMVAVHHSQVNGFDKWHDENPTDEPESLVWLAYKQGWDDADTFDDAWTAQHPQDLLDRILDEYPDMIENEVKARMKDLQNECETTQKSPLQCENCPIKHALCAEATQKSPFSEINHFCNSAKMVRTEIAMRAMAAIIPTTSPKDYQRAARLAVNYADALITELENN